MQTTWIPIALTVGGLLLPGCPEPPPEAPPSPGQAQEEEAEVLVTVNGEEPSDFTELTIASALGPPDESIHLTVERPTSGSERASAAGSTTTSSKVWTA